MHYISNTILLYIDIDLFIYIYRYNINIYIYISIKYLHYIIYTHVYLHAKVRFDLGRSCGAFFLWPFVCSLRVRSPLIPLQIGEQAIYNDIQLEIFNDIHTIYIERETIIIDVITFYIYMIYTWYILLFYRFLTSWPQLSVSLLPSPRQELQGAPPPTPTSSLGKCHLNGWLDLQFTLLWLWCDRSTDPLDHKRFKQVVQSTLAAEKNEELSEWGPESYIYICLLCVWNWRIESDSPHQTMDVSSRVLVVSRETSGWCGSGLMVPML